MLLAALWPPLAIIVVVSLVAQAHLSSPNTWKLTLLIFLFFRARASVAEQIKIKKWLENVNRENEAQPTANKVWMWTMWHGGPSYPGPTRIRSPDWALSNVYI